MEYVEVSQSAWVTRITMNRPQLHNAFNAEMIAELIIAFEQAAVDAQCRVVILEGAGTHFSAGADLAWMKSMAQLSYEDNLADAEQLQLLMKRVYSMPKPVVAQVQGASYGGALGLICACDIAIAEMNAIFCLSEVRIGLAPAVISPYVIAAIGVRHARRYMLTAEKIAVQQAIDLGLINECCPATKLSVRVDEIAATIASNGPQAVSTCKRLIQTLSPVPMNDVTRKLTIEVIADLRVSAEGQEGLNAFLNKRAPRWVAVQQQNHFPDGEDR